VEKKNLSGLIQAYARYRELASNTEGEERKAEIFNLVLLGDGLLKPSLCRLISELDLQDVVHLPGFKQYNELPVYYALASAFVHASTTEQWGLVVNEAMASGLPVLVSNRCGCAMELVQEERNGFTFDPLNTEQLARLMVKISAFSFPLSEFGSASRQIAETYGTLAFGEGLYQAVSCALRLPSNPSKWLDQVYLSSLMRGLCLLSHTSRRAKIGAESGR
jgi:glycosyltransferase involved in cell wall biosynthesis